MSWIKRHLSPSLVISIVALSVALGGTAFALTRNSVGADELKRVQVLKIVGYLPPGESADLDRNCNGGQLLGGGVAVDSQTTAVQIESSHAKAGGGGWEATVANSSAEGHYVTVQALCLKE